MTSGIRAGVFISLAPLGFLEGRPGLPQGGQVSVYGAIRFRAGGSEPSGSLPGGFLRPFARAGAQPKRMEALSE